MSYPAMRLGGPAGTRPYQPNVQMQVPPGQPQMAMGVTIATPQGGYQRFYSPPSASVGGSVRTSSATGHPSGARPNSGSVKVPSSPCNVGHQPSAGGSSPSGTSSGSRAPPAQTGGQGKSTASTGRNSPQGPPPPDAQAILAGRAASAESSFAWRAVQGPVSNHRLQSLAEGMEVPAQARSASPCNRTGLANAILNHTVGSASSKAGASTASGVRAPASISSASDGGASSSAAGSGKLNRASAAQGKAADGAELRLRGLEAELAQFTAKMEEMREVASSLHEEVRSQRPGSEPPRSAEVGNLDLPSWWRGPSMPPRGGNGAGLCGGVSTGGSSGLGLMQAFQRSLLKEATNSVSSCRATAADLQDLRSLRQEFRNEVEARRQAFSRLEMLLLEEARLREEAVVREASSREAQAARLEERWHTTMKEETAIRRAVEGQFESRLMAVQQEVRLEISSATSQSRQLAASVAQLQESIWRELDAQKLEINTASAELARLVEQLHHEVRLQLSRPNDGETSANTVSAPSALARPELTESLVRAEVRKQLSERSNSPLNEGKSAFQSAAVEQAISRLDRLETALEREASSRVEANSKMLVSLQDLVAEGRRRLEQGQMLEERLQAKIEETSAEARNARREGLEEQRQRKDAIEQEIKEREETCFMLLKSLEDKIFSERKRFEEKLQEERNHTDERLDCNEQALQRQIQSTLEMTAGSRVERSTKDILGIRQDVLELREELQDGLRGEREARVKAIARLATLASATPSAEVPSLEHILEDQARLREDVLTDLGSVREELRQEAASRREDVQGVRSSIDRVREQVLSIRSSPAPVTPTGVEAASTAGFEAFSKELRSALATEIQAREEGDERCQAIFREALREERQSRERDYQALELRVQSEEQTIFVESGKREERDRDILSQLSKVDEELDSVKLQLAGVLQQRQRLDEIRQAQENTARRLESRIVELSDRLEITEPGAVPKLSTGSTSAAARSTRSPDGSMPSARSPGKGQLSPVSSQHGLYQNSVPGKGGPPPTYGVRTVAYH